MTLINSALTIMATSVSSKIGDIYLLGCSLVALCSDLIFLMYLLWIWKCTSIRSKKRSKETQENSILSSFIFIPFSHFRQFSWLLILERLLSPQWHSVVTEQTTAEDSGNRISKDAHLVCEKLQHLAWINQYAIVFSRRVLLVYNEYLTLWMLAHYHDCFHWGSYQRRKLASSL